MFTQLISSPLAFILSFGALVLAISFHEFSHAFMADRLGDPTPRLQGRLTLNPLAHLDPMGTLLLLFFRFGWGKPVQFDPFNLRNPRRDAAVISLAGPVSNLIFATVASLLLRVVGFSPLLESFLIQLTVINVVLAIFNLIPIHPLDGFKIVGGILPEEYASQWYELERYGMIFLIALLLPIFGGSPIQNIIGPPINFLLHFLIPQAPFI